MSLDLRKNDIALVNNHFLPLTHRIFLLNTSWTQNTFSLPTFVGCEKYFNENQVGELFVILQEKIFFFRSLKNKGMLLSKPLEGGVNTDNTLKIISLKFDLGSYKKKSFTGHYL